MVQAVALVSLQHIFLNVDASVESIHWMSFCLKKRWRPRQTTRKAEEGTFVHDYVRDIVQLRVILQATKKYAFSNGTHEPSKQFPLKIRPWQSTVYSPDTLVDICRQQIARILYIYIYHINYGMSLLPSNIWNLCGSIPVGNILFMITKQISGPVSWTS